MTRAESMMQIRAFARIDGLLLALVWTVSFVAVLYAPESGMGSLFALATPFFVAWRLRGFRTKMRDGVISYADAFFYSLLTFVDASIVFCVVQFVYLRFIGGGLFHTILLNAIQITEQVYKDQPGMIAELNNSVGTIMSLTPIQLALAFMMQNIFVGVVCSVFIAMFLKRRGPYKRRFLK